MKSLAALSASASAAHPQFRTETKVALKSHLLHNIFGSDFNASTDRSVIDVLFIMAEPISIGAIASLCHLAWQVYKLCKDASESFKNVSSEVLSLHAVIREAEENLTKHLSTKLAGLTIVVAGCRDVLTDLETLIVKYRGLGTKTQRVWDRMGWHTEDIAELRLRLISNTGLLSAFMK